MDPRDAHPGFGSGPRSSTADGRRRRRRVPLPPDRTGEAAGATSGSVTDIYLPTWFARNLPAIHLPPLAVIIWSHLRARRDPRRRAA